MVRCFQEKEKKKKKNQPSSAGVAGLIPGWDTKIPHASWPENKNIKAML